MNRTELDGRLKGWASEYGGGKYENIGYSGRNMLQTLVEHQGFVPNSAGYIPIPIRSAADEVESAVLQMEASGWFRQGRVLRCDYFLPNISMPERLTNLRRIGISVSRATYYDLLSEAKAYIGGALRQIAA